MKLSMIVPALNEAGHIGSTLADLAACRRPGDEVLVVDGGSSDATRELARPLCDRVIDSASGRARQMNAGATAASGELLWFVHADTRVAAAAAAALLDAVADGKQWGRFDVRLSGPQPSLRMVERMMNLRSCLSGMATGDQGIFATRAAFDAAGGFPDIPLMEDLALSKQLRRYSRPACLKERLVTSSRRWERDGVWPTILLMWRLRAAYALGADPDRLARIYRRGNRRD